MKKILSLVCIVCSLSACGPILPLQYAGHGAFIIDAETADPTLKTTIQLYNPNKVGGSVRNMDLELSIGDYSLGTVALDEPVRIGKKKACTLPFTLTTTFRKLTQAATSNVGHVLNGNPIPYQLQGELTLRKFLFFRKTYDVYFTDSVKLKELKF